MRFENLRQELANGPLVINGLLAGVTPADARLKLTPETWSIVEVLGHLYDEEREDFRPRLDSLLHRPADPWPSINPGGWVTERAYNERDYATMLADWLTERARSLDWLDGLVAPVWDQEVISPLELVKISPSSNEWKGRKMNRTAGRRARL